MSAAVRAIRSRSSTPSSAKIEICATSSAVSIGDTVSLTRGQPTRHAAGQARAILDA
jgi:hypothetical protein